MAARATVGWLVLAVLVGTPTATLGGQAARSGLAAVISGLHLTGPGVPGLAPAPWGREGQPVHERLLAVASTGEVLHTLDGRETTVVVTPEFDGDLVRDGAGLVLVHNHPAGPESEPAGPGTAGQGRDRRDVAIGHDGSVYAAAKPQRSLRARRCGADCYAAVREEVGRALRSSCHRWGRVRQRPPRSLRT